MRNYTIDTLEKLCHFEQTAKDGFHLLHKLAASEDDKLKEDAEFAFVELFQVALAETILSLDTRLEVLDKIEENNGISALIVKAYGRMLKSSAFIGHIRPSNETFKRSYYYPSNQSEIINYFTVAIGKLKDIALDKSNPFSQNAKNALIERLSDQLFYGTADLILGALKEIISTLEVFETPLRNKLVELSLNSRDLNDEIIQSINSILEENEPKSIEEQLKSIVTEAPWVSKYVDAEERTNFSSKKAMDLAYEYIEAHVQWIDFIDVLLKGEQRQTFYFAEIIGKSNVDKNVVIDRIIGALKQIPYDQQNAVFLHGFISGVNDDNFSRSVIVKLLANSETESHGVRQTRFLKVITLSDLDLIKHLLIANNNYLRLLEYIDLTNLSNQEIKDLTLWMKDINYSFMLQILYEVLRKQNRWEELKDLVNEYLYVDDILKYKSFINNSLHIEDLLKKSIEDHPSEDKFAYLINRIISAYDDFNTNDDSLLDRLTYFLLQEYWEFSWARFGDYLAGDNVRNYSLKMFLERYKFDNSKLFEWALLNTSRNPSIALQFMNIYVETEDGELSWEPNALEIINRFGQQKKVLQVLSSKLSNYTIYTYSAENLYQKRKRFIDKLSNHEIDEVKVFVKSELEYFSLRIEQERVSAENYELRINGSNDI